MKAPSNHWEMLLRVLFNHFHPACYSQIPIKLCFQDNPKEDKEAGSWAFNKVP